MLPMVSSPRSFVYFTAPKVRPRTSCFWLNQPMIRIGAMASVEAADSLAQNRPCGLEKEAMKAVSGAAFGRGQADRPEGLVPGQDDVEQQGRGDARHRHRRQHVDDLAPERGAVHARRLEDLAGDFAEVGVEHPDHDRQVDQRQHDGQADAACRAGRGRGRAGRSAPARRPPASSWWTASTSGCPWSAWSARRPSTRPPERRRAAPGCVEPTERITEFMKNLK